MSKQEEAQSRQWSEWDRETLKTEMSLEVNDDKLVIRAVVQGEEAGRLLATLKADTIVVTEIYVPAEIKIIQKKGFFAKPAPVPGRGRGYGTLLIRTLLAFARKTEKHEIVGGLKAADLQENRYALEWYSRRGFITERVPAPSVPGSVATFRFLI